MSWLLKDGHLLDHNNNFNYKGTWFDTKMHLRMPFILQFSFYGRPTSHLVILKFEYSNII